MDKHRIRVSLAVFFFSLSFAVISFSQESISLRELVEKNIQTAGGKERIAQIKNYSFQAGGKTYYLSAEGQMKITSGKAPVITEVILSAHNDVKRNCYNRLSDFEGHLRFTYQALARLYSGLFTLAKFEGQLEFQGLKKFGPKEFYRMTTQEGNLKVDFYIDASDFSLKRVVFEGFDPDQGKYEINHDYGPLLEVDGIQIPSSWFASRVGSRGSLYEISEVVFNRPLDKEFFFDLSVKIGEVKIAKGALNGNITESSFQRNMLQIGTNWTRECIKKAGFKTQNKLILLIRDLRIEIDFYDSPPPRGAYGQGAKFMMPNFRDENYIIILGSPEFSELAESIEPLLPIQVRLKSL